MSAETEFVYREAVPRPSGKDISWVLIGQHGAVELWALNGDRDLGGVEIHSRLKLYDFASEPTVESCGLLGGNRCWSDGSSLAAMSLLPQAFAGVDMRPELMRWYQQHLGGAS